MHNDRKSATMRNPTWRKHRSPIERKLKMIVVYSVLLCIVPSMDIGVVAAESNSWDVNNSEAAKVLADQQLAESPPSTVIEGPNNTCTTPGCVLAAAQVLEFMDKDVSPCDNFYKFACGGLFEDESFKYSSIGADAFSLITSKVTNQLKTILEEPSPSTEPKPFKLAKNLYKSCMNKTAVEAQGLTPLLGILEKLGGWPVLEKDRWDEEAFNWIETDYKLKDLGYPTRYFITFGITEDIKNSTKRVINLDQVFLDFPREYLSKSLNDTIVNAYYKYMVDIAVILGAERRLAEKELLSSLEFEMKLANISLPNEKLRNQTLLYNPMTIVQLSKTYPSIPWKEYINRLLPPSIRVNNSEVILVTVPSFITSLEKLMKETPKRVQANYVMWRVAAASVRYLNDDIRKRQLQYLTTLGGITEQVSWEECVDVVSEDLFISLGALYIRKYFHEEAKNNVIEMVDDIRKQFNQLLQKVDWMDDETKKSALEKAASMTSHIAYPEELLDDSKLEDFYQNLDLSDDNYFQGILNLSLFGIEHSFSKLRKLVNKNDWVTHGRPTFVDAFYFPIENSIDLPAGILQGIFFGNDRPKYMNYGAIGYIIGHEITHGFDDRGRQLDKDGNLVDWWTPSTKEKYLAKVQCIIDQYGNYTVEEVGLNLNGIRTQGENIADNGGIKVAYLAYNDWVARNGQEQFLPGLPYTPRQMFWISAANTWCSVYPPEALEFLITTGSHSPEEFRILGPLSNMPEFAEDFKCPIGSGMNPEKKCALW